MRARHKTAQRGFRGVLGIIDSVPELAKVTHNSTARVDLQTVVARLAQLALAQDANGTVRAGQVALLGKLKGRLRRNHMRPIARVAKNALLRNTTPQFAKLIVPPAAMDTEALIIAASEMAAVAAPYAATFVAAGLPPDFIDQLLRAAGEVKEVVDAKVHTKGVRTGATGGLEEEVRKGRAAVGVLDALVMPAAESTSEELVLRWVSAKREVNRGAKSSVSPTGAAAAPASDSGTATPPVTAA